MATLTIGVFSIYDIQNKNDLLFRSNGKENAVVPDAVTVNGAQITFESLDIRAEKRIGSQRRINSLLNFGIVTRINARRYFFLKSRRFSNAETLIRGMP
jgi:hypothetical protein